MLRCQAIAAAVTRPAGRTCDHRREYPGPDQGPPFGALAAMLAVNSPAHDQTLIPRESVVHPPTAGSRTPASWQIARGRRSIMVAPGPAACRRARQPPTRTSRSVTPARFRKTVGNYGTASCSFLRTPRFQDPSPRPSPRVTDDSAMRSKSFDGTAKQISSQRRRWRRDRLHATSRGPGQLLEKFAGGDAGAIPMTRGTAEFMFSRGGPSAKATRVRRPEFHASGFSHAQA